MVAAVATPRAEDQQTSRPAERQHLFQKLFLVRPTPSQAFVCHSLFTMIAYSPRAVVPILALAASVSNVAAVMGHKTCKEEAITSLSSLVREAESSDVFVRVDEQYSYGDDSKQYKELCDMYEKTSEPRKQQVKIVKVDGDDIDKGGKELAEELGAADSEEYPVYFLIKKGTTKSDFPAILEKARYAGDERNAEKLSEFLKDETGATIGSFVYSLGMMDALASKFMSAGEKDAKYGDMQRYIIVYSAKALGFVVKFRADNDLKLVSDLYVKAFTKMLESDDYAQKQTDRITKLMEKDTSNMSHAKREQMSQKVHILSKFTDPKELTAEENRSLMINIGMNLLLAIGLLFTTIQMFLPGGKEEEGEEDDAEEDGEDAGEKED